MAFQHALYITFIFFLNMGFIAVGVLSPVGVVNIVVFGASHFYDTLFVLIQLFFKPFARHRQQQQVEEDENSDGKLRNVLCVVSTYKEEAIQVTDTLDSLVAQEEFKVLQKRIVIVCDGFIKYDGIFSSMILIETFQYKTFKLTTNEVSIFYCTYKGCGLIALFKHKNVGKKDSLILVDNIFIDSLLTHVRDILLALFNIPNFHYIFHTDADSVLSANTLRRQSRIMQANSKISGVTGIVLVPEKYRFWSLFQGFQYFYGQLMRRMTESIWGKLTCLPGCTNMVNISHDCIIEAATRYKKLPSKAHLFQVKNRLQGTDQRYTNCILQYSSKVRLAMDYEAKCYTIPPQTFRHFQSQQKRWTANSTTGFFFLVTGSNIPWYVRILATINLFSIHTCIAHLSSTFLLLIYVKKIDFITVVVIALVTGMPYLFFLYYAAKLKKYGLFLVTGSLVSKIVSPFITVFNFLYCVYHFNDNSWGMSHGASSNEDSSAVELTRPDIEIFKKINRDIPETFI